MHTSDNTFQGHRPLAGHMWLPAPRHLLSAAAAECLPIEEAPGRLRMALEVGIGLVLIEGLLRRAFPEFGTPIMALKFVYFALLYLAWAGSRTTWALPLSFPAIASAWVVWSIVVTLINAPSHLVTSLVGIAVNAEFVVIALMAAELYRDATVRVGALWRLVVLSSVIGVLAIMQAQLPAAHWLNAGLGIEPHLDAGGRVSSTFQFCNVFGNFGIGGTLICFAVTVATGSVWKKAFCVVTVAVLLAGLSFSGSRVGFFGSLLMAVFCLVFTTNGFRNLLFLALGGALVLTWAGSLQQWTGGMTTSRSTNAEGLFTRVRDSYLGELLHNGYEASGGIGLGWGPVTMGVIIYLDGFGLTENWPEAGQLEGGYSVLIAEGGVVGLILFVGLHLELWRYPAAGMPAFFAPGIALWSLIGNLPLHLQGIPAISILWWFLVGFCIALSDRPMDVPAYAHRPG